MTFPRSLLAALLMGGSLATLAAADVVPIPAFTGDTFEDFENLQPPGGYPGPFTILNGGATINDQLANTFVFATSVASDDTNWVNFFPYNGFLMGLVPTGWTTITFNPPVRRFGGYIGSAAIQSGGSITFKDSESQVIHSSSFAVPSLLWEWQGWQSDVPIASIEIHGNVNPGKPLVFDDLQISVNAGGTACYANCDESTSAPILNVADFTCFLNRFAAGESYANCDQSTTTPTLNVADFTCFLQQFAAGCP